MITIIFKNPSSVDITITTVNYRSTVYNWSWLRFVNLQLIFLPQWEEHMFTLGVQMVQMERWGVAEGLWGEVRHIKKEQMSQKAGDIWWCLAQKLHQTQLTLCKVYLVLQMISEGYLSSQDKQDAPFIWHSSVNYLINCLLLPVGFAYTSKKT